MRSVEEKEQNFLFQENTLIPKRREYTSVYVVVMNCSMQMTSFDSGTGWPSFTQSIKAENFEKKLDLSHGMIGKEVKCAKCGAHLG
jgi:peptide methionine sulfoxide reductase MsrB